MLNTRPLFVCNWRGGRVWLSIYPKLTGVPMYQVIRMCSVFIWVWLIALLSLLNGFLPPWKKNVRLGQAGPWMPSRKLTSKMATEWGEEEAWDLSSILCQHETSLVNKNRGWSVWFEDLWVLSLQAKSSILSQTLSAWDPSVLVNAPGNQSYPNIWLRTDTMLKIIMIEEFRKSGEMYFMSHSLRLVPRASAAVCYIASI